MKTLYRTGIFLTLPALSGPLVPNTMHIRLNLLLLFLCLIQVAISQSTVSRVTFPIDEVQTAAVLAKAGIDLSHGHGKHGGTTVFSGSEYLTIPNWMKRNLKFYTQALFMHVSLSASARIYFICGTCWRIMIMIR